MELHLGSNIWTKNLLNDSLQMQQNISLVAWVSINSNAIHFEIWFQYLLLSNYLLHFHLTVNHHSGTWQMRIEIDEYLGHDLYQIMIVFSGVKFQISKVLFIIWPFWSSTLFILIRMMGHCKQNMTVFLEKGETWMYTIKIISYYFKSLNLIKM